MKSHDRNGFEELFFGFEIVLNDLEMVGKYFEMMGSVNETDWIAIEVPGSYFERAIIGFEIHLSVFVNCLWFIVTDISGILLRFVLIIFSFLMKGYQELLINKEIDEILSYKDFSQKSMLYFLYLFCLLLI